MQLSNIHWLLNETLGNALNAVLLALQEVTDSGTTEGKLFPRLLAKIEKLVDHLANRIQHAVDESVGGKGKTSEEVRAILNRLVKDVRAPSKIKIPSENNVR